MITPAPCHHLWHCDVCCVWMWQRIIPPSTISASARPSTLRFLLVPTAERTLTWDRIIFQVTVTSLRLWRTFFRVENRKMNSSARLEYRSCRNNGISALKSAEIMEKNKPATVVVLRFFIYDTKNFWVNPRTVRQLASFWYNEFKWILLIPSVTAYVNKQKNVCQPAINKYWRLHWQS